MVRTIKRILYCSPTLATAGQRPGNFHTAGSRSVRRRRTERGSSSRPLGRDGTAPRPDCTCYTTCSLRFPGRGAATRARQR